VILFFGPPGSGKSVQGQLLVKRNKWQWISTGDLFRRSTDTEVLRRLASGELVNDKLTNETLSNTLNSISYEIEVILDGYPRNIKQAQWLITYAQDHKRKVDCVILFDVPREELIKRLTKRARSEDSIEIISHRLDIYENKTHPVIDFYRNHNVPIMVIDGFGSIPNIHERIQIAIKSCLEIE
jgi:adenylate kinase